MVRKKALPLITVPPAAKMAALSGSHILSSIAGGLAVFILVIAFLGVIFFSIRMSIGRYRGNPHTIQSSKHGLVGSVVAMLIAMVAAEILK